MSRECWGCRVRPHEAEKCERLSGVFKTWQQHHVIPQQTLKREFPGGVVVCETTYPRFEDRPAEGTKIALRGATLREMLGDSRNMVWMREYHHGALEGRVTLRIFFEQVPVPALEFAHQYGLAHHVERLYPSAVSIVAGNVPSSPTEYEAAIRFLSELAVTPASDVEGDEVREERWEP